MSVIQTVQEKSGGANLLGALGSIATLAGAATGQPWLSALGTGLGAANGMKNGNNSGVGGLQDILTNFGKVCAGWFNPAEGNLAKVKPETDTTPLETVRNEMQGVTPSLGPYETAANQAAQLVRMPQSPTNIWDKARAIASRNLFGGY